jgi:hypothetical protein
MGRLDVLAELEGGVKVNIEVQNRNEYDMERPVSTTGRGSTATA